MELPWRTLGAGSTGLTADALWARCTISTSRTGRAVSTSGTCCSCYTLNTLLSLDALGAGRTCLALNTLDTLHALWSCRTCCTCGARSASRTSRPLGTGGPRWTRTRRAPENTRRARVQRVTNGAGVAACVA